MSEQNLTNKMPEVSKQVSITRWNGSKAEEIADTVVSEECFHLFVNGISVTWFTCLPQELDALALGYLMSRGIITKPNKIRIKTDIPSKNILCTGDVDKETLERIKNHCTCSSREYQEGNSFYNKESESRQRIKTRLHVSVSTLYHIGQQFESRCALYRATGGVHSCGIYDFTGKELAWADDISRNNAVDKAIGKAITTEVNFRKVIGFTSSRIAREIVFKVITLKIPILASCSAPTSRAVWLAVRYGITLIGFLRGHRMNVYSHPQRIVLDPVGSPQGIAEASSVEDKVADRLFALASDCRVSCTDALEVAREYDWSPSRVGALCDKLGIKLSKCQLGCFG